MRPERRMLRRPQTVIHPGRVCGVNNEVDYGACCGNENLTCTDQFSNSCTNTSGNMKCCALQGTACHSHCECCAGITGCINGVCARDAEVAGESGGAALYREGVGPHTTGEDRREG